MSNSGTGPFEKRNKLARTPAKKQQDSGFISNFLNVSQNISAIEEGRRSLSFNEPSSASTFVDREKHIDDSHGDSAQSEQPLINLNISQSEPIQGGPSILDHYNFSRETVADLFSESQFTFHTSPIPVHSLKYLAHAACITNHIDATEAFSFDITAFVSKAIEELHNERINRGTADFSNSASQANSAQYSNNNSNSNKTKDRNTARVDNSANSAGSSQSNLNSTRNQSPGQSNTANTANSTQGSNNSGSSSTPPSPNENNTGNPNTFREVDEDGEMALSINTILRGIEKFSSKTQEEVECFIASVELYNELAGDDANLKATVVKVVKSRLKAITSLGNVQNLTLVQIIERIRDKFKLNMTFETAQEKLLTIRQNSNEKIDAYGDRVKQLLDIMNVHCSTEGSVEVQNAKTEMNENLAIKKFKQNLSNPNARVVAIAKDHTNLYEAISFVIEKFEALSATNSNNSNNSNTSNGNKNKNPSEKQQKHKAWCHICKKNNHFTRDCYSKNKTREPKQTNDKQQNESSNKHYRSNKMDKSKYNGRSMNQASTSNSNIDHEPDDDNSSECSDTQSIQLQTYNAHLNC